MSTIVSDKGRDLTLAAERLRNWLTLKVAPARVVEVRDFRYPVGAGASNETILFEAVIDDGTRQDVRPLVARVSPAPEHQLFLDVAFEKQVRLLQTLHEHGLVRVPQIHWHEDDPSWMDRPFFVMEQLRGRVPVSSPVYNESGWLFDATPAQRRTVWESATREFAAIHRVPTELVRFLGEDDGTSGFDAAIRYADAHYDWVRDGVEYPVIERLREWLEANRPADAREGLSWGDARMGNMMFGDDYRLIAVMDWEQASLAGPWVDLGWWLFFDDVHSVGSGLKRLDGLGTRQETIDLWEDVVGLKVPDLLWYEIFTAYRVATLVVRTTALRGGPVPGMSPQVNVWTRLAFERLGWGEPRD